MSRDNARGPRIAIEGVCKRIGKIDVLSNINLSIEPGEAVGLAGVNGSGKTMLMRVVLGLVRPTKGSIAIDGRALGKKVDMPARAGALLEAPAFLPGMTGWENLSMLASIRGIAGSKEIEAALNDVGLNPEDRRRYRQYSLGMKQRLGIAAAVMEEPSLLVLDEPSNALDTAGVEMLVDLVGREHARGATVIVSSHDAGLLACLCDRVVLLENGRLAGGCNAG